MMMLQGWFLIKKANKTLPYDRHSYLIKAIDYLDSNGQRRLDYEE